MTYLLEVDGQGGLYLPAEFVGQLSASGRYALEIQGETIVLRPANSAPLWQRTTPAARVTQWQTWAAKHQGNAKALPDEALQRDSIYD